MAVNLQNCKRYVNRESRYIGVSFLQVRKDEDNVRNEMAEAS